MIKLTRPQREALKLLHSRLVADAVAKCKSQLLEKIVIAPWVDGTLRIHIQCASPTQLVPSYRSLRKKITHCLNDGCVFIQYSGMCLGIEKDGHIHS